MNFRILWIFFLDLQDSFRSLHPELKRYSWRKKNPTKQARLDFFLTSYSLSSFVYSIKFENSYRSDHSPVVLLCILTELKKGRGIWKFNNSLLTDKDYIQLINELIISIKKFLLMGIRGITISYASYKNSSKGNRKKVRKRNRVFRKKT